MPDKHNTCDVEMMQQFAIRNSHFAMYALGRGETDMADFKLGIIGGGNMAEAILRGALAAGFVDKGDVVVSDTSPQRRAQIADSTGATCMENNRASALCDSVLLAVKPQVMNAVLDEIATVVRADTLVISIAAGVKTSAIDARLAGKGRIVRVMPNTPMLVGEGMSAICSGPRATAGDVDYARRLFAASGKTCEVSEGLMDAVTAVSGSGPAYFFYLIEAMIAAGVAEGLPDETAGMLAVQTCAGAARLLISTGESAQSLRAKVTSPNGTTQRAIETMEALGVRDAIVKAVRAAAERSRELGKEKKR